MKTKKYSCHCGIIHEVDLTNPKWEYIHTMIQRLGNEVKVKVMGQEKAYSVPRIYIAVHGLKAKDVPKLGFKEAL